MCKGLNAAANAPGDSMDTLAAVDSDDSSVSDPQLEEDVTMNDLITMQLQMKKAYTTSHCMREVA